MINESSENVLKRLAVALLNGKAIDYGTGMQDREVPEVTWATYGLPENNEIVVTANVGGLCVGIADQSSLIYPAMIDRVFGPDADDVELAARLSEQLWNAHSDTLIAEAERIRQSSLQSR